jgi:DNA-binding transcriptional ArsR family regulator
MTTSKPSEARWAKAISHPLRAAILERLARGVATPGELAAQLGAPLGVVSYHVRMLRDYGMVELVRTEPKRGALQHFYRAIVRGAPDENLLRTQLAAVFGVRAENIMLTVSEEPGVRIYEVHAEQWAENGGE